MKTKFTKLLGMFVIALLVVLALGTCQGPVADASPFRGVPTNPGMTNLAACWDLEETSGIRYDYTANDNDLADGNTTHYATGISGNAADFELDELERLQIADNAYLSMGDIDMTITFWVNLESKATTQYIVRKYSGSNRDYMVVYDVSVDRFRFYLTSDGTSTTEHFVTASNFGAPSTATWYFVIAQYDHTNDTMAISVNGGTANSAAHAGGIFDGTNTFYISEPNGYVDGKFDTATIYKRYLTADELTWLYNAGAGRACADLNPPTPTPTNTATITNTPTITDTPSNTPTITDTPTNTPTITDTPTDTPTITLTPTDTPTITLTASKTFTPTFTNTFTPTLTFTRTSTNTRTPTNTLNPTQISETEAWLATYTAAVPGYRAIADDSSPLVAIVAALCGVLVLAGLIGLGIFLTSRRKK